VKLYYAPKAEEAPAPANPPAGNAPSTNPPSTNAPSITPAAAAPPATVPQTATPSATVPVPPAAPSQPGHAQVRFAPATVEAKQGATVNVSVQIDSVADLFSASTIRIKYDPALLKLNDASPGELFSRDGIHLTQVKDIRNEVGEATMTIARAPGTKGITGAGAVLMLNFTAIGKGKGTITLPEFNLKNSQLQPVAATPGELPVTVN
jgi:hypothetical protein